MRITFLVVFLLCSVCVMGQLRFEYDTNDYPASSDIRNLIAFDGRIFFSADDGFHGNELWVHEPETDRTYMVQDIRTGLTPSFPEHFLRVEDRLVFAARLDPNGSYGIFSIFPGSPQPRISPGGQKPDLSGLAYFKGKFYTASQYALLQLDLDTPTGQRIHPDLNGSPNAYVSFLGQDEDYLYFTSIDEQDRSRQIFRYDGNEVEQLTQAGDYPDELIIEQGVLVQNHLALVVLDNPHLVLLDLNDASISIDSTVEFQRTFANRHLINTIIEFQDQLYFQYEKSTELPDLKRYQIAERQIDPDFSVSPRASGRWALAKANGKLYGWVRSGGIFNGGREVWEIRPDGNHLEVTELKYALENDHTSENSQSAFAFLDNKLYAYGNTSTTNFELLNYDLTTQEITDVAEINPSTEQGSLVGILPFDSTRLAISSRFAAEPRLSGYIGWQNRVRTYDPATQAMESLDQLAPYEQVGGAFFHKVNDRLIINRVNLFDTLSYRAVALNVYTDSIEIVDTIGGNNNFFNGFGPFVEWQDKIYFSDRDVFGGGNHLQVYDPATQTTTAAVPVDSVNLPTATTYNNSLALIGDTLYIVDGARTSSPFDFQLSKIDTQGMVSAIELDSFTVLDADNMTIYSDRFFIRASIDTRSYGLYYRPAQGLNVLQYQGAPIGRILLDNTGHENDSLIFFTDEERIFSMDKRTDDVELIVDLATIDTTLSLNNLVLQGVLGDYLLFSARFRGTNFSSQLGLELYQYNLTTNEFQLAADINPGSGDGRVRNSRVFKDRLYFTASDGYNNAELWSYRPGCFELSLNVEPDTVQTMPNGFAAPEITNGTPPYTYRWSNGATTATVNNLEAGPVSVTVTDREGCSGSAMNWITSVPPEIVVATEEQAPVASFDVFPNPTTDRLLIQFNNPPFGKSSLHLFSATGKQLMERAVSNQSTIELSLGHLPAGIYYLQIQHETGSFVKAVVVK